MEIQLVDNVLREIQRRSQKAARDQLYQYQKYLQNMYSKIEKLRYLACQECTRIKYNSTNAMWVKKSYFIRKTFMSIKRQHIKGKNWLISIKLF